MKKKTEIRNNLPKRSLIPAAVLILCFILAACGTRPESTEDTGGGMARVCLYAEEENEDYQHDMEIIEGRVSMLSGGNYTFEKTTVEFYDSEGNATGERYPGVEISFPQDACSGHPLTEVIRTTINRPVNLWIGLGTGDRDNIFYNESIPIERSDIVSVTALEGCPPGLNPLDYGIDQESFRYLQLTLSEAFRDAHPEISEWDRPGILQDKEGYSNYFTIDAVPSGDGLTFWLLLPGESQGYAETLAYDYTYEPLRSSYYILDIPEIIWEEPDPDNPGHQVAYDDFNVLSILSTYEMEQTVCTEWDWEKAMRTVKERLEALQISYAVGRLSENEHSLALRIERGPYIYDLLGSFVIKDPSIDLQALGKTISISPGDAKTAVSVKDGRYVLDLDMSAYSKDTLHKLSGLSQDPEGERIAVIFNSYNPLLWADVRGVIRDGKITMDHNALTGEIGFEEKYRFVPDLLSVVLNEPGFPRDAYRSLVTLNETSITGLDAEGRFCLLGMDYLDYSGYLNSLKEKAAPFSPQSVSADFLGDYTVQFDLPEEDVRVSRIAEDVSRLIPLFRDDIFMCGISFSYSNGDETISISCSGAYSNPTKMNVSFSVYGVPQETADDIVKTLSANDDLRDMILF